jgi:transcriptional regulator GlxA family with amidase domain
MQHREEAVELSLNAGPVAAEKPADQYGEVQLAAPAEMPRIGNMTRTQFRRMKVADEPAQYRDNPSSYREIVRITTFRILPAQPRVYKPLRLKLIGLISVGDAARTSSMSERNFLRLFKRELGVTPSKYLLGARLDLTCRMLVNSDLPVDKIARRTGLSNGERLSKLFRKELSMSPTEFRARSRRKS